MHLDRRLAAILSADVKGYSRLMAGDDVATVRTLAAHRAVMSTLIRQHQGRVVDAPGDNLLAEFPSALSAVEGALAIQKALQTDNESRPHGSPMQWRIGLNVGDVLIEGDRMYGDGVNVAARVQELADAGGICLSGTMYDQVKGKLRATVESLGEQRVKNIAEPIRVYRVSAEVSARSGVGPLASPERTAVAASAAPRPSIAVLPFSVIGRDPDSELLADGMTEEIITTLSKVAGMSVIASQSVFRFKGTTSNVHDTAAELGVRHVLEGTVRRAGARVRITVQLLDAATGVARWAERYDREVGDIFALQEDITRSIATALAVTLGEGDEARIWGRGTHSFEAWECYMQAVHLVRAQQRQANAKAREYLGRAIEIDPGFALAYVTTGWSHFHDARWGWGSDPSQSTATAEALARRGLELDPLEAEGHSLLGALHLGAGRFAEAVAETERSVALSPGAASILLVHGWVLSRVDREEEALPVIREAIRLSPTPPPYSLAVLSHACRLTGRHEEALDAANQFAQRSPQDWFGPYLEALARAAMGREAEARAAMRRARELNPAFGLDQVRPLLIHRSPEKVEEHLDVLRRLGVS
jgi:adenylate cyclase